MPPAVTTAASIRSAIVLAGLLLAACQPSAPGIGGRAEEAGGDLDRVRAENALDEQRHDLARVYLAAVAERRGDDPEPRRRLARAWSSGTMQSASRALEHWRGYLELRPGDAAARLEAARAGFTLGEWAEAAELTAGLGEPAALLVHVRALAELDPQRALEALPRLLEAGGELASAQAAAARVEHLAGDAERALEHARRALELDPTDRQSLYLLARLEQRRGRAEEARRALETHQLLARFAGAGSAREVSAAERLRVLEQLEPRLAAPPVSFRLERLRLWVEAGRHAEATAELDAFAAEPAGLDAAVRLELAGLAEQAGRRQRARRFLEATLAELPAGERGGATWREASFGLALLDHREGDPTAARRRLAEILEAAPACARCRHLLGRLDLAAGDEDAAAEGFGRALELAPWKADCRLELARLEVSRGRLEEALRRVAAAPEEDPALRRFEERYGTD